MPRVVFFYNLDIVQEEALIIQIEIAAKNSFPYNENIKCFAKQCAFFLCLNDAREKLCCIVSYRQCTMHIKHETQSIWQEDNTPCLMGPVDSVLLLTVKEVR